MIRSLLLIFLICLIFPLTAAARIGVGVGIGKVRIDEQLKPGMSYNLPTLPVINTGDEPAQYLVTITYHEAQPELRPDLNWLQFSPQNFQLAPGQVMPVNVTLNLPIRAVPGNYFAYLEAQPDKTGDTGNTRIGIAAASKLNFTVVPANIFSGIYYKLLSLWRSYSPWSSIIPGLVLAFILVRILRSKLNIQISVNKKSETEKDE